MTITKASKLIDDKRIARASAKYDACLRLITECNKDYSETGDKRFLQIRNEAKQDAKYWRTEGRMIAYGLI